MLLHTAERPKRRFSRFCTLQKGQKEVFYASAHCRKSKKRFFMLLHTAERLKRSFSRFCTLQKDQKEFFMLLHIAERPKRRFSRYIQRMKHQKEIFSLKASRGSMKFWLQLLYDNNAYRPAIGWGRSSFIFVFLPQFLVFFRKFASNS